MASMSDGEWMDPDPFAGPSTEFSNRPVVTVCCISLSRDITTRDVPIGRRMATASGQEAQSSVF